MKTYGVYKEEWYADSSYEALKEFTYETLRQLYTLLEVDGGTELGHLVTGLNDDSYSDGLVEDLKDIWFECNCDRGRTISAALQDKFIRTYETYHRCLNISGCDYDLESFNSPEGMEKEWVDCLNTELDNFESEDS